MASPASGTVANFRVKPYEVGDGFKVTLSRIAKAPNVASTLLNGEGHWIVESNRVTVIR